MNRIKLRENTFKLLFCNEFHAREDMPRQYELFWDNIENISDEERKYMEDRVTQITAMTDEIDTVINGVSVGWSTGRMAKVDLTILRLAYYEMKVDDDIPEKVAIDQAVELAKKYGSDDSPSFVNGILAKIL